MEALYTLSNDLDLSMFPFTNIIYAQQPTLVIHSPTFVEIKEDIHQFTVLY